MYPHACNKAVLSQSCPNLIIVFPSRNYQKMQPALYIATARCYCRPQNVFFVDFASSWGGANMADRPARWHILKFDKKLITIRKNGGKNVPPRL